MKLDILKNSWIDIVFEGRNKAYGAYELRKSNPKTTMIALILGALIFSFVISLPKIATFLKSNKADEDVVLNEKIVTVKLPPKEEKEEVIPATPPPPPPPPVDQKKFVKPVVAKTEEVTEEPPKMEELKDKKIGDQDLKGDPDAPLTVEPVGDGPIQEVTDEQVYNLGVISVKPDFPGGLEKFYKYVARTFRVPEVEGLKGRVLVTFIVEKDGSLTDIKVIRDGVGHGADKEAIRVLEKCPKWTPGEQNGKKVRVLYSLPITIRTPD